MTRIIVIEDETPIRERIVKALSFEGYDAVGAENGREGLALVQETGVDLIIADIMMPELDGLGLVSVLRSDPATRLTPVIMLTALDERASQRKFMEIGADDYITKPFDLSELLGAVQAQLRKQEWRQEEPAAEALEEVYSFGGWRYETDRRRLVSANGEVQYLTSSEAQLLMALIEHPKTVMKRETLFDLLGRPASSPFDRTIDVLISRLRRKLEQDPKRPRFFVTVRSIGYIFDDKVEKVEAKRSA